MGTSIQFLSEDGQFLTYGLYPQTAVSDPSLISSLDATATLGSNGWYFKDGDYYTKENAYPYGSPSYTLGNGKTIADGAAYWFKCEPIKWRVLQNSNGEAFVVSESILNAQRYDDSSNNYADSEIREWLHSNFFIRAFALGYDTELEQGGVNVSGGQRQRLCIARALLKHPKILILDDSTSAVDTATEASIREAFRNELSDSTKIIIAQRITSVMEADKIIVMDDGAITGIGTHDELLKSNSAYQEIYHSQMDGKEAA